MLDEQLLKALERRSAPDVFNGLKRLGVAVSQLECVDRHAARSMAPALGSRIGFAATRRVATRTHGSAPDATENKRQTEAMNRQILALPTPRFLVVEDVGDHASRMCIWGELAATINLATGCVAGLTNGPVRDIREMEATGFVAFANGAATGGGFIDPVDVGTVVTIGGLSIAPGDLLLGDMHGIVKIPLDLAAALPAAIEAVDTHEAKIRDYCRSGDFTPEGLAAMM